MNERTMRLCKKSELDTYDMAFVITNFAHCGSIGSRFGNLGFSLIS